MTPGEKIALKHAIPLHEKRCAAEINELLAAERELVHKLYQSTDARDERAKGLVNALKPLARIADVVKSTDRKLGLWSEQSNFREPVRLLLGHAFDAKEALSLYEQKENEK